MGEMASPREKSCTSSGKGGKKRQFICLDFSQLPTVKHYAWSINLRYQIPCPVGSISSKSGNDGRRQTGYVASECQRAFDIVHKMCSQKSNTVFLTYQKRKPGTMVKNLSQGHMASKW